MTARNISGGFLYGVSDGNELYCISLTIILFKYQNCACI